MLPEVKRFIAYFDKPLKAMAVKEFMEQNDATFEQATIMLHYEHGVDFLLCSQEGDDDAH